MARICAQQITLQGKLSTLANEVEGQPFLGPNDLVIGPDDVVYMTDPGRSLGLGQVLTLTYVPER